MEKCLGTPLLPQHAQGCGEVSKQNQNGCHCKEDLEYIQFIVPWIDQSLDYIKFPWIWNRAKETEPWQLTWGMQNIRFWVQECQLLLNSETNQNLAGSPLWAGTHAMKSSAACHVCHCHTVYVCFASTYSLTLAHMSYGETFLLQSVWYS